MQVQVDTIGNMGAPCGRVQGLLTRGSEAAPKSLVAVILAGRTSGALGMAAAGSSMASLVPPLTPDHGAPSQGILSTGTTLVVPPVSRTGASEGLSLEPAKRVMASSSGPCPVATATIDIVLISLLVVAVVVVVAPALCASKSLTHVVVNSPHLVVVKSPHLVVVKSLTVDAPALGAIVRLLNKSTHISGR